MTLSPYLAVAVALATGACNSAPAATTEFFGPTIEPPRGLAKISPGMSVAEAMRHVPQLREDHGGVRDRLVLDSGVSDVRLEVRVDTGTVASIFAIVQGKGARELLTRAWGQPQIERDSLGQPEVTWESEATGWKVELDCIERNCLVEYVPYHVLTTDFFGAHVVPPGDLSRLHIGMTLAEARKIAPGPIDVRGGMPTGVDGVRQYVAIDDKRGVVRAIYLNLPPRAKSLIEEAWGTGFVATEPVGKTVLVWPDPTTSWRATLRPALGLSHDLAYDNYLPAAELFGEQPDVLDAVPVLGMTVEEVKRDYSITPQGKDLVLTLLPTEWERTATRITLGVTGGRVRELAFSIPFKAHPEARDTLFDLFRAKWGEPRPAMHDPKLLVFRDGRPRVEVREGPEHGVWKIEIR
ncbi:MAG: hypothetical protein H0T89_32680 [Deltaproteobacteria bacterium]|nr:hypothetical protein [Deltaproteobacteria bacterium]MDQ3299418.1 hypothetical protein [Myxococcota bacterium]